MKSQRRAVARPQPMAVTRRSRGRSVPSPAKHRSSRRSSLSVPPTPSHWEGKTIKIVSKSGKEATKTLGELYNILQSAPPKKQRDKRPDLTPAVVDQFWDSMVALQNDDSDKPLNFHQVYTYEQVKDLKSYMKHLFLALDLYNCANKREMEKVFLEANEQSASPENSNSFGKDDNVFNTMATNESPIDAEGVTDSNHTPESNDNVTKDSDKESPKPANRKSEGKESTQLSSEDLSAVDNKQGKEGNPLDSMAMDPELIDDSSKTLTSPLGPDSPDSDASGIHSSSTGDANKSPVPIRITDKLNQLRNWVYDLASPTIMDEQFVEASNTIIEATKLIEDINLLKMDLEIAAKASFDRALIEACGLRAIALQRLGIHGVAADKCSATLEALQHAALMDNEHTYTEVRFSLCWCLLGQGKTREYQEVFATLTSLDGVASRLKAMNKVNKTMKDLILQVRNLPSNHDTEYIESALKKVDEVLAALPGSTYMHVNKVCLLSKLGKWDMVQALLEDIALKTANQVGLFTGDLLSESPFSPIGPQPGDPVPYSVVCNLLDVRLTKSYIRSLIFNKKIESAKFLLCSVTGSQLPVDRQDDWNRWASQELGSIWSLTIRMEYLDKFVESHQNTIIFGILDDILDIEFNGIFQGDSATNVQGDVLTDMKTQICVLRFDSLMADTRTLLDYNEFGMANTFLKEVLRACGYGGGGQLDDEKPFPWQLATPSIAAMINARAPVLARFGVHWNAWKDYGFLFDLSMHDEHGLGSQKLAFEHQLENSLKKCPNYQILGLAATEYYRLSDNQIVNTCTKRMRKYHNDKNRGCHWCSNVIHRIAAIKEDHDHSGKYDPWTPDSPE